MHAVSAYTESQEACLLVCYHQWWASRLIGSMTNHTWLFSWKEAIAVFFIHQKLTREWGRRWWPGYNSRMKRYQWKPRDKNLENTTKNPMTPCLQCINRGVRSTPKKRTRFHLRFPDFRWDFKISHKIQNSYTGLWHSDCLPSVNIIKQRICY